MHFLASFLFGSISLFFSKQVLNFSMACLFFTALSRSKRLYLTTVRTKRQSKKLEIAASEEAECSLENENFLYDTSLKSN